jgi:hypothetical protein
LPTGVGYNAKLQPGQDPGEDYKHTDDLPWDCIWQFVQKFFSCLQVTRGLRLWARLDELPNSVKRHWTRLMVETWKCNCLATALVEVPAIIQIAHSLITWDIVALCWQNCTI